MVFFVCPEARGISATERDHSLFPIPYSPAPCSLQWLRQSLCDGRIDQPIGFALRGFAGETLTLTQGLLLAPECLLPVSNRLLFAPQLVLLLPQCRKTLFDGNYFGLAGTGAGVHVAHDGSGKLGGEFALLRTYLALPRT